MRHLWCPNLSAITVLVFVPIAAASEWVQFVNETATRLIAESSLGSSDQQEKDYAWGDVDHDGDIDLVVARKQPFTSPGKRVNVLLMNEVGVLVDRTSQYASAADVSGDQGFLTPTNDRDVVLVDVDLDGWPDIVTAVTLSDGDPKHIGHPRVYHNLGTNAQGEWLGFLFENDRIPTMLSYSGLAGQNPRFCAVAAGDLTGDGYPELWFADHDNSAAGGSPEPAGYDFNDKLLLNGGNGYFTDVSTGPGSAFSGLVLVPGSGNVPFVVSAYSPAAAIGDMNGDGAMDIVKLTSLNSPLYLGIAYNNPVDPGFFNNYDVVSQEGLYYVAVGDLNNDDRLDMIVVDDLDPDRYFLNLGNGDDARADFTSFTLPTPSGTHSGGQTIAADLNNDGWDDVIIADVPVDLPTCNFVTDVLRNNANPPYVTFTADPGNIPSNMLSGVYHSAVFDIDGDGWNDLVLGRCTGTQVWINQPLCPADINNDGVVNPHDLALPLGAWGPHPGGHPADLNGDGVVGAADLALLLGAWGPCP